MESVRTRIRKKLKALLTGIDVTGDRVFYDHVYAISAKNFPCLAIHTQDEKPVKVSLGTPAVLENTLSVNIYILVSAKDEYQDIHDNVLMQIRHLIASNINLDGLVISISIENIDVDVDDTVMPPIASLLINLEVVYRAMENKLDISI